MNGTIYWYTASPGMKISPSGLILHGKLEKIGEMAVKELKINSLVVYKNRPARILDAGAKLTIALENGDLETVRHKDVTLIHPGPFHGFEELGNLQGEVELAWEIMLEEGQESSHDLLSVAELVYGEQTPASAWVVWELMQDGLYFSGSNEAVTIHTREEVKTEIQRRAAKAAEELAWESFLERIKSGQAIKAADQPYITEVEKLAYGKGKHSRLLQELRRSQTPQNAHALLLELGVWDSTINPYLQRLNIATEMIKVEAPVLPQEERRDLTHLKSFAIDDRDNLDPDDAVSLEALEMDNGEFSGAKLWVHVADAAAVVTPDSKLDFQARERTSTLYLPEGMLPMLPGQMINDLGLGLKEKSPALSFGITLNAAAKIAEVEIIPSWVRVQRLTYEKVEERLHAQPFNELLTIAQVYCERRAANRATFFDMPEAKVSVDNGLVSIRPLLELESNMLVREAMLMAGEAAAKYAIDFDIPFAFVTQDPIDEEEFEERLFGENLTPGMLAYSYAARRLSQRSQDSLIPNPHAGIGLGFYSRVTSPLRRYLDLVAHQQLRAHLAGTGLIGETGMLERIGAVQSAGGGIRQAEWCSRRHWTCVYFQQNPDWSGEGVLVEQRDSLGRVIIPELAFETRMHLRKGMPLNSTLTLKVKEVNLPELEVYFEVDKKSIPSS